MNLLRSIRCAFLAAGLCAVLALPLTGCRPGVLSPLPTADLAGLAGATLAAATLAAGAAQPAAPASPTPVVAQPAAALLPSPLPPVRTATPLVDPIRFTFPTQGADPISLWRAPLYPTPWEPTPNDHFYFTRPIGANEVNWPLARYRYGYLFYTEPHTGIDVPAPKGAPVMAAGPGTVIWAGYGLYFMRNELQDPYGIAVAIRHDFGYNNQTLYTVYGHLDQAYVYRGQRLEGGEQLGVVGETGKVTGPHLHFEVRLGDSTFFETRNPELWISPPQGAGLIVGRVYQSNGDLANELPVKLIAPDGYTLYEAVTYAEGAVNTDDYYRENLVLGDLPAGVYTLILDFDGSTFKTPLTIQPGQVTFFTFRQRDGFLFERPPDPGPAFIPPDGAPTVAPLTGP
ncbi:MAG: M23 family metallopeptidase [Chloroflexota bacterium]